jgi:hypothetical protein
MRRASADRRARGLAALAGIVAIAVAFRVRRSRAAAAAGAAAAPPRRDWDCTCGQAYEVSGTDRHRIYWLEGRPVVEHDCPQCGAPLPAEHESVPG